MIKFMNNAQIIKGFNSKTEKIKDCSEVMRDIAEDMRSEVQKRFRNEKSPDGEKWEQSKRAKEEGGKTLSKTGRLKGSITGKSGKDYAVSGTNTKYASTHNEGVKKGEGGTVEANVRKHTRKTRGGETNVKAHTRTQIVPWGDIPQRQFLGFGKSQKARYKKWIKEYLKGGE